MSHYTSNLRKNGLPILYYIYKIIDSTGKVIDAGYTTDPKSRFYDHVHRKPGTGWGNGRHYGRTDIRLRVIYVCETKEAARNMEDHVKIINGLPTTERDLPHNGAMACIANGQHRTTSSKGGKSSSSRVRICPTCGREIKGPSYFQHVKKCMKRANLSA